MDGITKNCTNCLKLLGFHYDRVDGRFCSEKCRDEFFNKLQGRDDLNSNKTPKEFCKNKKGLEEKNL